MHYEPLRLDGEGTFETTNEIAIGTHRHAIESCEPYILAGKMMNYRSVEPPCVICEAEDDAFLTMVSRKGEFYVEGRMNKLDSYRAYNQRWPFDAKKMVLSAEVVFEEKDNEVWVDGYESVSTLDTIMDNEAADELLVELTEDERQVIQLTSDGFKPREIAAVRGEKTSARVRQEKYSALRKLGAPINSNMRRVK